MRFVVEDRYDRLAQELGSQTEYPALGAAIGIERLLMLLEPIKNRLAIAHTTSVIYTYTINE